jgi:hypothetical protein
MVVVLLLVRFDESAFAPSFDVVTVEMRTGIEDMR